MVPLRQRPAEANDRTVPSHWEGDLVMGRRPSAIATLAECASRYTVLVALPGVKADDVQPAPSATPSPPCRAPALVTDLGPRARDDPSRPPDHRDELPGLLLRHPQPWQRGTNENTNRLLRQYFPAPRTCAATTKQPSTTSPHASTDDHDEPLVGARPRRSTGRPRWSFDRPAGGPAVRGFGGRRQPGYDRSVAQRLIRRR